MSEAISGIFMFSEDPHIAALMRATCLNGLLRYERASEFRFHCADLLSLPCRCHAALVHGAGRRPRFAVMLFPCTIAQDDRHSTVATTRGGISCVAILSPRSRSCCGERG